MGISILELFSIFVKRLPRFIDILPSGKRGGVGKHQQKLARNTYYLHIFFSRVRLIFPPPCSPIWFDPLLKRKEGRESVFTVEIKAAA